MKMLKTLFVPMSLLVATIAQAQFPIVGEHPGALLHLSSLGSGTRLISRFASPATTGGSLTIYNLDLSVHRVLNYPPPPAGMWWTSVQYITEELFDTDPTTIEFMLTTHPADGPGNMSVHIFHEDGTELFSQVPGSFSGGLFAEGGQTYMVLHTTAVFGPPARIYALPGSLPCMDCYGSPTPSGIGLGGTTTQDPFSGMSIYPNPSHTNATVVLDDQITDAMEVYNGAGQLVRTIATAAARQVEVDTSSLPAGNYTVVVLNAGRRLATLPLVIAR